MKQYAKILKEILSDGSIKPPAREGLPSTLSVFGKSIVIKNNEFPILKRELDYKAISSLNKSKKMKTKKLYNWIDKPKRKKNGRKSRN